MLTCMFPNRARELRTELARKIAVFIGPAENRATEVPGLTLHRRIARTAPCSMTYEPSVTVIAQGAKARRTRRQGLPLRFVAVSADVSRSTRGEPRDRSE